MTAHQLAAKLLEQEDLPVVINGWGSDEGNLYAVEAAERDFLSFNSNPQPDEVDALGYNTPRPCISLNYN